MPYVVPAGSHVPPEGQGWSNSTAAHSARQTAPVPMSKQDALAPQLAGSPQGAPIARLPAAVHAGKAPVSSLGGHQLPSAHAEPNGVHTGGVSVTSATTFTLPRPTVTVIPSVLN